MQLAVDSLRVGIGKKTLLDGVSFTLEAGENLALLGQSGSGKSLTAAAITGTLGAEYWVSGAITIFGQEVCLRGSRRCQRPAGLAAVSQDSLLALNPLTTVGRQLITAAGRDRSTAAASAAQMLASLGFEDAERIMRSFPTELSGGQRQRVCIALALLTSPQLLIADEPTTALDTVTQMQLLRLLQENCERRRVSILFISHDIKLAAKLCQRAVVLQTGKVSRRGPTAQMLAPAPEIAAC